jgi:cytochrome c oxidase subunit 4
VICFFMHLIWEANWKYVLTVPASLMSVFLVVALVPDVGQRVRYYAEERSLYASEEQEPVHGHGSHSDADHKAEKKEDSEKSE